MSKGWPGVDCIGGKRGTLALTPKMRSGRVVIFPRFQREFAPKPPPGKHRKASGVPLSPLGQGQKEEIPALPTPPAGSMSPFWWKNSQKRQQAMTRRRPGARERCLPEEKQS
ncbi:uncharacterized protein [Excalfactoria chinensis]|uniref:uncharacterized protein isoform X2 n=1 Tax=Excalfactoria chinensis TaxID=46218 RepID=UPI003B3AF6F1